VGFLAGPVAWAVQVQAAYALAPSRCGHSHWPMHLVTFLCLAGALAGGWVSYRHWQGVGGRLSSRPWEGVGGWPSDHDEPDLGRSRLMAVLGLLSAGLFALVIVANWIAVTMLTACSPGD
jgi:hypothetical protein